jgi:hypothetical protein
MGQFAARRIERTRFEAQMVMGPAYRSLCTGSLGYS